MNNYLLVVFIGLIDGTAQGSPEQQVVHMTLPSQVVCQQVGETFRTNAQKHNSLIQRRSGGKKLETVVSYTCRGLPQ